MASNFSDKYREFMSGRNGVDTLSRDLVIVALVVMVVSVFLGEPFRMILSTLGLAALLYAYYRMFSRDLDARRAEEAAYTSKRSGLLGKLGGPFKSLRAKGDKAAAQAKDKEHRYFTCPACGQEVRVPKGVGKIRVTCPKCGEKFEKKA